MSNTGRSLIFLSPRSASRASALWTLSSSTRSIPYSMRALTISLFLSTMFTGLISTGFLRDSAGETSLTTPDATNSSTAAVRDLRKGLAAVPFLSAHAIAFWSSKDRQFRRLYSASRGDGAHPHSIVFNRRFI